LLKRSGRLLPCLGSMSSAFRHFPNRQKASHARECKETSVRPFKSVLVGASPTTGGLYTRVAQSAEAMRRERMQCGCKSRREYHFSTIQHGGLRLWSHPLVTLPGAARPEIPQRPDHFAAVRVELLRSSSGRAGAYALGSGFDSHRAPGANPGTQMLHSPFSAFHFTGPGRAGRPVSRQ
jgi:hypothetical protein